MASNKQKLELTWIGKDKRPRLEPRILLEDQKKSYHAKERVSEDDIFDNKLIFGDNLLALKALEAEYTGQVKCIYIDPPYNTGNAFEHYEDGLEHSIWLSLMRDRLELLRNLLSEDGSLWITIDDNEAHYLKVMCDEVFERNCFCSTVIWRSTDNSNNDAKKFSVDHNMILVYSRKPDWRSNKVKPPAEKRKHFNNPDNDPRGPWFDGNPLGSPNYRENLIYDIVAPNGNAIKPPKNGWRWSKETLEAKVATGEIRFNDKQTNIKRRTYLTDQAGLPPSTLWADLDDTGHNRQAKYEQKKLFTDRGKSEWFSTPKPEKLISRILKIATKPGDLVLDSFAGSGTTAAVAHKMKRKWISIELKEHCHTHIIPRLQKVIDGNDPGGISKNVNWKGGGGFRYYHMAPSMLQKDKWKNWIISKNYNPEMLAQAMCKHMGFTYKPNEKYFWIHGCSTETDFIYVTTNSLIHEQLKAISEEVGPNRTLLICCKAFNANQNKFKNLTIKKIPLAVLTKCEWGKDDYSLNVQNLPTAIKEKNINLFGEEI